MTTESKKLKTEISELIEKKLRQRCIGCDIQPTLGTFCLDTVLQSLKQQKVFPFVHSDGATVHWTAKRTIDFNLTHKDPPHVD